MRASGETHFNAEYYRHYYERRDTAVVTPRHAKNEVAFVVAFCRLIGVRIKRFADVGAGTGWWARELAAQYSPRPIIETYDASLAACKLYGHRYALLQELAGRPADLVVCRDVVRYIPDSDMPAAFAALARKCRAVLYLHAVTREDEVDEEMSDMRGRFRASAYYRRELKRLGFRDCGMGLFVSPLLKHFDPWALETR